MKVMKAHANELGCEPAPHIDDEIQILIMIRPKILVLNDTLVILKIHKHDDED